MARAVTGILLSWWATAIMALLVSGYWLSNYWPPAAYWYELRHLHVDDARVGEPVLMRVDRQIHKHFVGEFGVIVRKRKPDGWMVVCNGSGGGDYRPDAILPEPLTLDWWSNRACPAIDVPGHYTVTTTITMVSPLGLQRVVKHESNIFEVRG